MYNIRKLIAAVGSIILLTGCAESASAELKGADTVMITVGDHSVTKADMFTYMKANDPNIAVDNAVEIISNSEVKDIDSLKAEAEEEYAGYESAYGDYMQTLLAYYGTDRDGYINDYILPRLKLEALEEMYVTEKGTDLISEYNPVKAVIISHKDSDEANTALESLTEAPDEDQFNMIITSNATTLSDDAVQAIKASERGKWNIYTNDETSENLVYYTEDLDPEKDAKTFQAALKNIDDFKNAVIVHYLKKHNFRVYDTDLHSTLTQAFPNLFDE